MRNRLKVSVLPFAHISLDLVSFYCRTLTTAAVVWLSFGWGVWYGGLLHISCRGYWFDEGCSFGWVCRVCCFRFFLSVFMRACFALFCFVLFFVSLFLFARVTGWMGVTHVLGLLAL